MVDLRSFVPSSVFMLYEERCPKPADYRITMRNNIELVMPTYHNYSIPRPAEPCYIVHVHDGNA
jgi:hypothetical protein